MSKIIRPHIIINVSLGFMYATFYKKDHPAGPMNKKNFTQSLSEAEIFPSEKDAEDVVKGLHNGNYIILPTYFIWDNKEMEEKQNYEIRYCKYCRKDTEVAGQSTPFGKVIPVCSECGREH